MKKIAIILACFIMAANNSSFAFECESILGVRDFWMRYLRATTDRLVLYSSPSLSSPLTSPITIEKSTVVTSRRDAQMIRDQTYFQKERDFSANVKGVLNRQPFLEKEIDQDKINTNIFLGRSIKKTTKPEVAKATKNGSFEATESYGPIKSCAEIDDKKIEYYKEYHFHKGDVIEYLLDLEDDNGCLLRFHGDVFMHNGDLCYLPHAFLLKQLHIDNFEVTPEYHVEWWISVMINDQIVGWTIIDKNNKMFEVVNDLKI